MVCFGVDVNCSTGLCDGGMMWGDGVLSDLVYMLIFDIWI